MRPSPQFESTCACARFFYMSFSGLLLYHALRSSAVAVCEPGVFGPSGGQFQVNVLPRGNGGSISRGSVWREGKHRPRRQAVVRRDRADVRTGPEKAGSGGPWKGSAEGGKPSGVRRCAAFAEKLPVFLLFTGTFATKFALFFLSVALFRAINRREAPINGDENESESARMYIRGVKNWWFHPFLVNLPQRSPRHIRISRLRAGDFNLPHERKTPHPRGAAECRSASPPSLDPRVVLRGGLRAVVALRHAHLR